MIRYADAVPATIEALVDEIAPNWRTAAQARTAAMAAAKRYLEGAPSWSDVKPVFMRLQYNKCAFCERPLAGEVAGKVEQDIEHFRPKNAVKAWPRKPRKGQPRTYAFSTSGAGTGYYWLAYNLGNYAAACKPCNSGRKGNYFPIAGRKRGGATRDIASLNAVEMPYLIYPLGYGDGDPEEILTFDGILAKAVSSDGWEQRRASVTIDFFGLNVREELWADRFRTISDVWYKMAAIRNGSVKAEVEMAQRGIADAVSDSAPQASCARSFLRLFEADPIRAWETFQAAETYWRTAPRPRRQRRK